MAKTDIQCGKLLLSEPFMLDPYFRRAVVLLCEHWEEGSLGFILNKKLDIMVSELLPDLPDAKIHAFYGGPVQTDTLHYIHTAGNVLSESQEVAKGIFWGGDFDELKARIQDGIIKWEQIRFFVGYSGWSEGQLAEELEYGSWIISDLNPADVFRSDIQELWQDILERKGSTYEVISTISEFPNVN